MNLVKKNMLITHVSISFLSTTIYLLKSAHSPCPPKKYFCRLQGKRLVNTVKKLEKQSALPLSNLAH